MAARDAHMAVLPEQRRDDRTTVAIAIVPIVIRTDAEGSVLHASETVACGTAHAGAHVTLPNVQPLTYVMYRCNRYGVYVRWMKRGATRATGPHGVRSIMGRILDGNVQHIGSSAGIDVCPVDPVEARETERCIMALPEDMREAIIEEHVIGGTQQQKADELKIDRTTFWRRCNAAYPRLLGLMNLAAAGLPLNE